MRFKITTLGCKINQFDAGLLAERLTASGAVASGADADVQVVFTCTVTGRSDYQCRQAVRRAARDKKEGGLLVVTGCYAQTSPEAIKNIPGVDLVVGTEAKDSLPELILGRLGGRGTVQPPESGLLLRGLSAQSIGGRSRASLKVQEGCDAHCSYCIVPSARGRSRSAPLHEVIERTDALIARGYYEIVLTGVHLGSYGKDLDEGMTLSRLVGKLLERPGLGRLRLSSVEPMEIDDGLLGLMGSGKLCRHFHVPLQSASDKVLASMGRGYTARDYFEVIEKISGCSPGACMGADVIVGYPAEDDAAFEDTCRRIEDSPLNHLHVFSYSPRPGTAAFALGDPVRGDVKGGRSLRLRELADGKNMEFRKSLIGKEMTVVVEEGRGIKSGITDNYVRVHIDGEGLTPKSAAAVRIEGVSDGGWAGKVI